MPEYSYINDDTGETIIVFQKMKDKHEYYDSSGKKWRRVFVVPQVSIDVKINPMDSKDFVEKTRDKKGTLGDLFDASREASEQRERSAGVDPIKEQNIRDWKENRKRKDGSSPKHPSEIKNISIVAE